jgi:hypothetical protein
MIRKGLLIAKLLNFGMVDAEISGRGVSFRNQSNAFPHYIGIGSGSGIG